MNRRLLSLLLACALALSLCGCSKKDRVIRAIEAIGTVTLDSQEKIEKAEGLYARLEEAEKAAVTNKDTLTRARAELDRQNALIQKAADAIQAIGTVTITQAPAVTAARQAYDAAVEFDIRGSLEESLQVLLDAEASLQQVITDSALLFGEIDTLKKAQDYATIEALITPYVENLPAGELKRHLASALVDALCEETRQLLDVGSYWAASQTLSRCAQYETGCTDEALAKLGEIRTLCSTALSRIVPANGRILARTYNAGRNIFTITVGSTDTCVKLELVNDPEKYVIFYARANETVKVNLLNGTYRIKYTTGPVWYGETDLFGPDATYLELAETVEFAGYTTSTHVYWHTVSCTLHTGYDDTLGAQNLAPEAF